MSVAANHAHLFDVVHDALQFQWAVGMVGQIEIEDVTLLVERCVAAAEMVGGNTSTRTINGLLVLRRPASERLQNGHLWRGNRAIGHRSEVQKEVATLADAIDEGAEQDLRTLEIMVIRLVAPRIVHRVAEFPITVFRLHNRHPEFRRGIVAVALNARIDNHRRILATQKADDAFCIPVFRLLFPVAVKPEKVGMELRVELVELREIEIHEMLLL